MKSLGHRPGLEGILGFERWLCYSNLLLPLWSRQFCDYDDGDDDGKHHDQLVLLPFFLVTSAFLWCCRFSRITNTTLPNWFFVLVP